MKLILVPRWLEKALTNNDLSLSAVLDEEKLLATVSMEDVAFYLYVNQNAKEWLGQYVVDSFSRLVPDSPITDPVSEKTKKSFFPYSENVSEQMAYLTMETAVNGQKRNDSGVDPIDLVDPLSIAEISHKSALTWRIRVLNDETLAIIPEISAGDNYIGMINYLLSLMNDRMPFHELAQTPVFERYLSSN